MTDMATIEKGKVYSREVVKVEHYFMCPICSNEIPWHMGARRKGEIFGDAYFCKDCLSKLFSKRPGYLFTESQRAIRLVSRKSRNEILSPKEISEIVSWFCEISGSSFRKSWVADFDVGYFKGSPLIAWEPETHDKRKLVIEFWKEFDAGNIKKLSGKSELSKTRRDMAVLLLILGDKHAIRHC